MNRVEDFGLRLIHDNSLNGREILCAPLDKFRALRGLVDREKVKERLKNTAGIYTPVLTIFQFAPRGFDGFSHQDGI